MLQVDICFLLFSSGFPAVLHCFKHYYCGNKICQIHHSSEGRNQKVIGLHVEEAVDEVENGYWGIFSCNWSRPAFFSRSEPIGLLLALYSNGAASF
jgi:hypothetical protein